MTDDDILDIVTDDDGSLPDQPDKAVRGVGGYRFITILLLLFAVGGLFLGLLGTLSTSLSGFTAKVNSELWWGPSASSLNDCLMGLYIGFFENVKNIFNFVIKPVFSSPFNFDAVATIIVKLFLMVMLAVAVISSIVTMIVSLVSRKRARSCAIASLTLNLIAYGGIFIYYFAMRGIEVTEHGLWLGIWDALKTLTDAAPGIVAAIALIALFIVSFAQRKKKVYGFLNILLVLCSLVSILAFFYPATVTAGVSSGALENVRHHLDFFNIALAILLVLMLFNFYVTCLRVRAKKAYVFDVVRYGLQMVALVLLIVAWALKYKGFETAILNNRYTIIMFVATVLAFLIALLIVIVTAVKKHLANKKDKVEEKTEEEETEEEEDLLDEDAIIQPSPAQPLYATYTQPEPAAEQEVSEQVAEPEPEPVAQQVVQPQQDLPQPPFAPTYNITYVTPQQQPVQPVVQQPVVQPAPQPAPQPVKEERPKTDFELYMEALAKGQIPASAPAKTTSAYTAAPSYVPPKPVQQPAPAPQPVQNNYYSQYTYDPFISTLTAPETTEFCDLFIGNKNGALNYLPAYVIGGDNADFFRRIFIYLGRYRKDISRELLEKIYLYVTVNYPA